MTRGRMKFSVAHNFSWAGVLTFAFPLFTLPLTPGFLHPFARLGGTVATAHQASARDSGLPQRVHPAARLRAEPRGNRPPLQPLVARHGAQAPHQPAGEGLHPPRLESQPLGRAAAQPLGRPRDRAADAGLRRRRRAHRSGGLRGDDFGPRIAGQRQARHLRAARARRVDDRRADSRRRLGGRRGPQVGRQRRDGHRPGRGAGRHAQEVLSRERAASACSRPMPPCSRSMSIRTACRFRASSSA